MGIDEIKGALADMEGRGTQSAYSLATVSEELETIAGQLAAIAQGSSDDGIQSAHGLITRCADDTAQAAQSLSAATESLRSYAGRL